MDSPARRLASFRRKRDSQAARGRAAGPADEGMHSVRSKARVDPGRGAALLRRVKELVRRFNARQRIASDRKPIPTSLAEAEADSQFFRRLAIALLTDVGADRALLAQAASALWTPRGDEQTMVDRPVAVVLALGFVLRAGLVVFSEVWDEANPARKYTDVDYVVFTDAAREVVASRPSVTPEAASEAGDGMAAWMFGLGSPYDRATYRYTPFLAWLAVPNVTVAFAWGKLVFAAVDVLVGWLIADILRARGVAPRAAAAYASLWLFSPIAANISTRGSADCIVVALSLLALRGIIRGHEVAAALWLGAAVHFKIFPALFAIPMALAIDQHSDPASRPAEPLALLAPGEAGHAAAARGTADDSTAGDGTGGDGTADDGTAGDGTAGDGTAGDGTAGDGTADDGTADDGGADSDGGGADSDDSDGGSTAAGAGGLRRRGGAPRRSSSASRARRPAPAAAAAAAAVAAAAEADAAAAAGRAMASWPAGDSLLTRATDCGRPGSSAEACLRWVRGFVSYRRVRFGVVSLAACGALTGAAVALYGHRCLHDAYIYHIGRTDPRHNFSPYFYSLYLADGTAGAASLGLAAFLPQLAVVLAAGFGLYRDLPLAMLVQAVAFVALNKVCTAQYFLWWQGLLPVAAAAARLGAPRSRDWFSASAGWALVAALFLAGQAGWLLQASDLEEGGRQTFLGVWGAGLVFLAVNTVVMVGLVLAGRGAPPVFHRGGLVKLGAAAGGGAIAPVEWALQAAGL
ncbi:hypothetical protein FNF27_08138 [Cafeteria roenbergensis]|uniref:GPI mannosyltransferase I n=2 Tax=Cafeteria roenbergensis TaxID=33653 RepID=A0A5A8D5Y8_CAFRO|nr:hypothetical protein FNF31_04111 [Cafeteria roenbergensis]KAA0161675.1 hypothetical protein FNF27_08138 [Cafeteria roenbergensis]